MPAALAKEPVCCTVVVVDRACQLHQLPQFASLDLLVLLSRVDLRPPCKGASCRRTGRGIDPEKLRHGGVRSSWTVAEDLMDVQRKLVRVQAARGGGGGSNGQQGRGVVLLEQEHGFRWRIPRGGSPGQTQG
eukprot:766504-Hanusia_phi.AAC.1